MITKIFAHRGASRYAPENTMPAFKLAAELGADGIETDVQLTKDHVPVLIHDENVKRTTNGRGLVKDFTYKEIKELDAGSWFSSEFKGTRILALEELLQWIKPTALTLNIELKNNKTDYKNIETIVYDMAVNYQLLDRIILSSFNANSVKKIGTEFPDVRSAFLTSRRKSNLVSKAAQELHTGALHLKYRQLNQEIVIQCHEKNMAIRIYTPNTATHIKNCFLLACDGVITDVPDKAARYRKSFYEKEQSQPQQDLWIGKKDQ